MPLPDRDFDTTEVAVPWRLLTDAGHTVTVATEEGGRRPECDPRLLTGVIFGQLGAEPEPIEFYRAMAESAAFADPISWRSADVSASTGCCCPAATRPGCASTSARRSCGTRWRRSGPSGARSGRSATACWCWPGPPIRPPVAACWPAAAPPACPSTWSGVPIWPPRGGSGPTTGPIRPTCRTRCVPHWTTRPSSRWDRAPFGAAPHRRPSRLRGRGRNVPLRPLARGQLPVRPQVRGAAGR